MHDGLQTSDQGIVARIVHTEGVSDGGWTLVLGKPGGRAVRADQVLDASEPERLRRWALVVRGSPFERVLSASVTEARLAPAGERAPGPAHGPARARADRAGA